MSNIEMHLAMAESEIDDLKRELHILARTIKNAYATHGEVAEINQLYHNTELIVDRHCGNG